MRALNVCYLDNAATSFPKPESVWEKLLEYGKGIGGNPGRSGHILSVEAARIVYRCRKLIAELLNVDHLERVIFTMNATYAANFAIYGLLSEVSGGNVVATALEHNAVARPLKYWCKRNGIELRIAGTSPSGYVEPKSILSLVDSETRVICINHASNVFGVVTPFEEVARKVKVPVVVDATQTLGAYPFDVGDFDNVFVVFTGHKGLLGPQGVGGLFIPAAYQLAPMIRGGTGSYSELDEQPDVLPDRFESGTLNVHGLAGLQAGIEWVIEKGVEKIRKHEMGLFESLVEGLKGISKVRVFADLERIDKRVPVVSFVIEGMDAAQVSSVLDREFGIASRPGLHCAPWAHKAYGTYPKGTVRFSLGPFNSEEDVKLAVDAVKSIAEGGNGC